MLPEIQTIQLFLISLKQSAGSNQSALTTISDIWASMFQTNRTTGMLEFVRLVQSLPSLVAEIPSKGQRRVAEKLVGRIEKLLDPTALATDMKSYIGRQASNIEFIEESLPLFEDLTYESDSLIAKLPDIYAAIEGMKSKFGQSPDVSDASKIMLIAQLDLLTNSVHRFQNSGIGAFRDSIFTIYGRITIQLESDENTSAEQKREIADDILRIYGVVQLGGDLLKLCGPVIAGLLAAPVA